MISIIIPTYNRAGYLDEAVRSVLGQDFGDFELIVVDDGSTDDTGERMARYAGDGRFRLLRQENAGRSTARNRGAGEARGDYLLFLDSDDMLGQGGLALLDAAAGADPGAGLVVGRFRPIGQDGEALGPAPAATGGPLASPAYATWQGAPDRLPRPPRHAFLVVVRGQHFMVGSFMIRAGLFASVGGFDPAMEPCEDTDLLIRVTRRAEVAYCDAVVALIRRHDGNTPGERFARSTIRMCHKRIEDFRGDAGLDARTKRAAVGHALFAIALEYYASGDYLRTLYYDARACLADPGLLLDPVFRSYVVKGFIPPGARERLKRFVSPDAR